METITISTDRTVTIHHTDHDINRAQLSHIVDQVGNEAGFFIKQVTLPEELGTVPCGLWGPAMGDDPIEASLVNNAFRGDRPWTDRVFLQSTLAGVPTKFQTREVDYVQIIGTAEGDTVTVFTVYGGPLAPQNPEDPSCEDVEASTKFWSQHALVADMKAKVNPCPCGQETTVENNSFAGFRDGLMAFVKDDGTLECAECGRTLQRNQQ